MAREWRLTTAAGVFPWWAKDEADILGGFGVRLRCWRERAGWTKLKLLGAAARELGLGSGSPTNEVGRDFAGAVSIEHSIPSLYLNQFNFEDSGFSYWRND